MSMGAAEYRFGPFVLDPGRRRLMRHQIEVELSERQFDLLLYLVTHAGETVSKEALIAAAWRDVAVTDGSLTQAVHALRRSLDPFTDGSKFIVTLIGKGYRFAAPVDVAQASREVADVDALLDPYQAFVDGRAAIETMDLDAVRRARDAFADALRAAPGYAAVHTGMAVACLLLFEGTRTDTTPDRELLRTADRCASTGCRLNPASADAWSVLALVRSRSGQARSALAAAQKAAAMDPDNWHQHLRLAWVSWGEERLKAARQALARNPSFPLAHWFAATVFVARRMFDRALDELRAGCAAYDSRDDSARRLLTPGLHWLHGMVLAETGDEDAAGREFEREIAMERSSHVYGREASANSFYAIGALHLRSGRRDDAAVAFRDALVKVPGHARALVGLAACSGDVLASSESLARLSVSGVASAADVDSATAVACSLVLAGRHHEAAALCGELLRQSEPGAAGWVLPVEPLLRPAAHPAWTSTLDLLRARAL